LAEAATIFAIAGAAGLSLALVLLARRAFGVTVA
jgi:hypothetical protein